MYLLSSHCCPSALTNPIRSHHAWLRRLCTANLQRVPFTRTTVLTTTPHSCLLWCQWTYLYGLKSGLDVDSDTQSQRCTYTPPCACAHTPLSRKNTGIPHLSRHCTLCQGWAATSRFTLMQFEFQPFPNAFLTSLSPPPCLSNPFFPALHRMKLYSFIYSSLLFLIFSSVTLQAPL